MKNRSRNAFTLVEVIVVIAILAIVSGAVVMRLDGLVPALEKVSAEHTIERALTKAAHLSWTEKKKFFVKTNSKTGEIFIENSHGKTIETFPLAENSVQRIRFRLDPRDSSKFFVPAQLEEISEVEFHPAGCTTPAIIEILTNGKTTKIFQIDPFSGGLTERSVLK